MYPKPAYRQLVPSLEQVGLAALDAKTQQEALQLRWILPLLFPNHPHESFARSWIRGKLRSWSNGRQSLLCLTSSRLHPALFKQPATTVALFCRTFDRLGFDWNRTKLAPTTAFHLHILDILDSTLRPYTHAADKAISCLAKNKILVSDIYIHDPSNGAIRRRYLFDIHRFRNLVHLVSRLLDSGDISLALFFVQLSTPASYLTPPTTATPPDLPLAGLLSGYTLSSECLFELSRKHFWQVVTAHYISAAPFAHSRRLSPAQRLA